MPGNENNKSALAEELLRLKQEPCQHFTETQIHEVLIRHTKLFMDSFEHFYEQWCEQKDLVHQPLKKIYTSEGIKGDFRVMPCIVNDRRGNVVKAVKIIGTNEEESVVHDKICVGKALLINEKDNFVEAIADVAALSSFRTAAISVLAFKRIAAFLDLEDQPLGVVGVGRIGFYTAHILHHWLGFKECSVRDVNNSNIVLFGRSVAAWAPNLNVKCQSHQQMCKECGSIFYVRIQLFRLCLPAMPVRLNLFPAPVLMPTICQNWTAASLWEGISLPIPCRV